MKTILFKDKLGNKIIQEKDGGIGLKNPSGKYCSKKDFREVIKENKLGNKIKLKKGGMLWVHNDFLE